MKTTRSLNLKGWFCGRVIHLHTLFQATVGWIYRLEIADRIAFLSKFHTNDNFLKNSVFILWVKFRGASGRTTLTRFSLLQTRLFHACKWTVAFFSSIINHHINPSSLANMLSFTPSFIIIRPSSRVIFIRPSRLSLSYRCSSILRPKGIAVSLQHTLWELV